MSERERKRESENKAPKFIEGKSRNSLVSSDDHKTKKLQKRRDLHDKNKIYHP